MSDAESVLLPTLDVGEFDPWTDSIQINGTRYAGTLFRELGCFNDTVGQVLRIDKKKDGLVTVTRLPEFEQGATP